MHQLSLNAALSPLLCVQASGNRAVMKRLSWRLFMVAGACCVTPSRAWRVRSPLFSQGRARGLRPLQDAEEQGVPLVGDVLSLPRGVRALKVIERIAKSQEATGGAGAGLSAEGLQRLDQAWSNVRNMKAGKTAGPPPVFVKQSRESLGTKPSFDVVVCGGTLGVFIASALQSRGFRVCIVERAKLEGRQQEWNISRKELMELAKVGILTREEVEEAISIDFNPIKVGFPTGRGAQFEISVRDVLNLGVSPKRLIEMARRRFEEAGGVVRENTAVDGITVRPDAAVLEIKGGDTISTRLVIDSMGHASPITRQARWGQKPDGICVVVGSLAKGFDPAKNQGGDLLYATTPIKLTESGQSRVQYFWEAFPASVDPSARTTYMFSYMDANPARPSLVEIVEDYLDFMPGYQGVKLSSLDFQRVLAGFFPTYRKSPLKSRFNRICAVGDASGIQSPLSFGGFGSLTRHIHRLTNSFSEALEYDKLSKRHLSIINGYQPALSASWLFQRAMSVKVGSNPHPHHITTLLARNFGAMRRLGDRVLRPFLQDVVQFVPLSLTMMGMMVSNPFAMPGLLISLGPQNVIVWSFHMMMLGVYSLLHQTVGRLPMVLPSRRLRYWWNRVRDNLRYGAGLDYSG